MSIRCPGLWLMVLLTAACGHTEEKPVPLTPTTTVPPAAEEQAALDLALKSRTHGELICHYHHPGAVYDVRVSPLRVTTILFQDDEQVVTVAAGDTERFSVDLTETDGKPALLVKPTEDEIRTNVSVVTNRRVYLLNLIADETNDYAVAFEPFAEQKTENFGLVHARRPVPKRRPLSLTGVLNRYSQPSSTGTAAMSRIPPSLLANGPEGAGS
ncbi:MAG: TrbG/VirB9 family P-type conjugative transfer protein [Geminicoccaceae bacterium]